MFGLAEKFKIAGVFGQRGYHAARTSTYEDRVLEFLDTVLAGHAAVTAARVAELVRETGQTYDQVLLKVGALSENQLLESLADFTALPIADNEIDAASLPHHPDENTAYFDATRCLPLAEGEEAVTLGLVDPLNQTAIEAVEFLYEKTVNPVILPLSRWEAAIGGYHQSTDVKPHNAATREYTDNSDPHFLKELASAEPIVRRVNRLLSDAGRLRATDLHIEGTKGGYRVRHRIDGVLGPHADLPKDVGLATVSRIKILSDLDIAETRQAQDGRFSYPIDGRTLDLRVSTVPAKLGESVVLRILDQDAVPLELEALGFSGTHVSSIKNALQHPNGIILITGPTGSGKSTTLYALLQLMAERDQKILTIEDPIERQIDGTLQSQVNEAAGVTFPSALRSFLRHDPDAIMVGEIRDEETARLAAQAALTGHLVLSTLHTNDAVSAITRLRDLGIEDYLSGSILRLIIAQRLVRRRCACDRVSACSVCKGSGFFGRLAIAEILQVIGAVSDQIKRGSDEPQILASQPAFTPLREDALLKVKHGATTASEIDRCLGVSDA